MRSILPVRALALLSIAALPSCWLGPVDDAGDEAFVAEAVINTLGRRVHSGDDFEALVALAASPGGRSQVVDVLMASPEFTEHWRRVLMDDLHVGHVTDNARACFEDEMLAGLGWDSALVDHLASTSAADPFCPSATTTPPDQGFRTVGRMEDMVLLDETELQASFDRVGQLTPQVVASPMEPVDRSAIHWPIDGLPPAPPPHTTNIQPIPPPPCLTFTMADVLRASIEQDRMDALYRAALVPLKGHEPRSDLAANKFMETHLGRDPSCMTCHTTTYSTTDPVPRNDHWDRFQPAHYIDVEGTTFSWWGWVEPEGGGNPQFKYNYGGNGGGRVLEGIRGFFRNDMMSFEESSAVQPWGMALTCMDGVTTGEDELPSWGFEASPSSESAHLAGVYGSDGYLGLLDAFSTGVAELDMEGVPPSPAPLEFNDLANFDPNSGQQIVQNNCVNACHYIGNTLEAPAPLTDRTKYMPASRIRDFIENGSLATTNMPPIPLDEDEMDKAVAYLTDPQLTGHVNPVFHPEPASGMAHLVAMRIVDNVYEELTGASLVLDHGFPRNTDAAYTLKELTREFVANDWSLKVLVKRIQLSRGANRAAPAESTENRYPLAMVFDPWAATPSGAPNESSGENMNSQGDLVHRFSIRSALHQANAALRHPDDDFSPFHDDPAWPPQGPVYDMGAYRDRFSPGFKDPTFDVLLAWEEAIDGCELSSGADGEDFIESLFDQPDDPTVEEALLAVKARLITDPDWWPGEKELLEDSVTFDLGDKLSDVDPEHDELLRDYCSSILMSPQFLMYGLPAFKGYVPPSWQPQLPLAPNDDTEWCEHYRDVSVNIGYDWYTCDTGSTVGR